MNSFRTRFCKVVAVYVSVISLLAICVPMLYALKKMGVGLNMRNYNNTVIQVESYGTLSGTCTYCDTSGGIDTPGDIPDCYDYQGVFAYAIVNYTVWQNESLLIYQGTTEQNKWCDYNVGLAIKLAQRYYGPVGSIYNGYYLLKDPYQWHWHIPGQNVYLVLMLLDAFISFLVLTVFLFHLCCMCSEKKNKYVPIEKAMANRVF